MRGHAEHDETLIGRQEQAEARAAQRHRQHHRPHRRAGRQHRHRRGRWHGGVLRLDDRLRHDPDRRPRQRLHEPVRTQRHPAEGCRRTGQPRRCGGQGRQFRRPGRHRALLRAAPWRAAGQSGQLAAAALNPARSGDGRIQREFSCASRIIGACALGTMPPSTGVIHARSPYRHPLAGPVASAVLGAADRARPEPGNQWAGSEQRGGGDLEGAAGGNPPFRGRVQRGARRLRGSGGRQEADAVSGAWPAARPRSAQHLLQQGRRAGLRRAGQRRLRGHRRGTAAAAGQRQHEGDLADRRHAGSQGWHPRRQAEAVRRQPHPPDHPRDQRAQPPAGAGVWLHPPEHLPGRYRFGLPEARAAAAEAVRWPAQGPGAGPAQQPGRPADRRGAGGR
ncbi:hypothetical protein G6F65_015343 [Rhizopus arrhizus]|nr:hypothetical protein G6F65_015343 [Rhizopus arrhizus]